VIVAGCFTARNSVAITNLPGRQHYLDEFHRSAGCRPEISEARVQSVSKYLTSLVHGLPNTKERKKELKMRPFLTPGLKERES